MAQLIDMCRHARRLYILGQFIGQRAQAEEQARLDLQLGLAAIALDPWLGQVDALVRPATGFAGVAIAALAAMRAAAMNERLVQGITAVVDEYRGVLGIDQAFVMQALQVLMHEIGIGTLVVRGDEKVHVDAEHAPGVADRFGIVLGAVDGCAAFLRRAGDHIGLVVIPATAIERLCPCTCQNALEHVARNIGAAEMAKVQVAIGRGRSGENQCVAHRLHGHRVRGTGIPIQRVKLQGYVFTEVVHGVRFEALAMNGVTRRYLQRFVRGTHHAMPGSEHEDFIFEMIVRLALLAWRQGTTHQVEVRAWQLDGTGVDIVEALGRGKHVDLLHGRLSILE